MLYSGRITGTKPNHRDGNNRKRDKYRKSRPDAVTIGGERHIVDHRTSYAVEACIALIIRLENMPAKSQDQFIFALFILLGIAVVSGAAWWVGYSASYASLPPDPALRISVATAWLYFLTMLFLITPLALLYVKHFLGTGAAGACLALFASAFVAHAIAGYDLLLGDIAHTLPDAIQPVQVLSGYVIPVIFAAAAGYIAFVSVCAFRKMEPGAGHARPTVLFTLFLVALLALSLPHVISGHVLLRLAFLNSISFAALGAAFLACLIYCLRWRMRGFSKRDKYS